MGSVGLARCIVDKQFAAAAAMLELNVEMMWRDSQEVRIIKRDVANRLSFKFGRCQHALQMTWWSSWTTTRGTQVA